MALIIITPPIAGCCTEDDAVIPQYLDRIIHCIVKVGAAIRSVDGNDVHPVLFVCNDVFHRIEQRARRKTVPVA